MELYEQIVEELEQYDSDDIGKTEFISIAMPELTRIVLRNAKGNLNALSSEILAIRRRHRHFRKYLTDFDDEWGTATTKRQRHKLQTDFENAWKALLEGEQRPKERLMYKLWDVLENPTEILQPLGNELPSKGLKLAVVSQVRGLHAFCENLLDAHVATQNMKLLGGFQRNLAEADIWYAAANLGASISTYCTNKE